MALMLTKEFCNYLEYHLTEPLSKSPDINLRRCWCDGVLMPESEDDYSIETVNNTGKIVTKAWINEGRTRRKERGQRLYTLVIHFGSKSMQKYMDGEEFKDCLSPAKNEDWLMFDFENKRIRNTIVVIIV